MPGVRQSIETNEPFKDEVAHWFKLETSKQIRFVRRWRGIKSMWVYFAL
jgi:hypothetical protein